jgi:hypothetical protein
MSLPQLLLFQFISFPIRLNLISMLFPYLSSAVDPVSSAARSAMKEIERLISIHVCITSRILMSSLFVALSTGKRFVPESNP